MSVAIISLILLGVMVILLAIGSEVFVAIGIVAAGGLLVFMSQSLDMFTYTGWSNTNVFSLTAVPLFIFMGSVFAQSGAIRMLFRGCEKVFSFIPGGMAASTILANAVFGAISGSSIAAVASFGTSVLPEMEKMKYGEKLALGSVVMGGTISCLIPPSVPMIVYGGYQGISVPRLFAGGMIPGLILALLLLVTIIIWVKLKPKLVPPATKYSFKEKIFGFLEIAPSAIIILVVLLGILLGITTTTEAAAIGAFLSVILAIFLKKMNFTVLKSSALTAVKVTAMILPLIIFVRVLSYDLSFLGITEWISDIMLGLNLGKYVILAMIIIMYMILGCFLEGISIMLLSLAFVVPILEHFGMSLVWFGVLIVIVNELGLVTPPFGLNLFALHAVAPKHSLTKIAFSAAPFYPAVVILILLVIIFPDLILWLPDILF